MTLILNIIRSFIDLISPTFRARRYKNKIEGVFYKKNKALKQKRKIIYTLTPPSHLSNIGDHAQVVAIYKWFEDTFPDFPIIELDKNECLTMLNPLKRLVNPEDLIFIHSGGNLGERGLWSETGRRNIISNFPENKIVSLPQTIFFSDTVKGENEKLKTIDIYNKHKNLTVIGRDPESARIAAEMFPQAKTFAVPDFVLYLDALKYIDETINKSRGILFCLRNDNESILKITDRSMLSEYVDEPNEFFDTTFDYPIERDRRDDELKRTLAYFAQFEAIVTDRYHGLIFAVLLGKPTIVLPTVDHKLTSAIEWFNTIDNVKFLNIDKMDQLKTTLIRLKGKGAETINWKEKYFNSLSNDL